MIVYFIQGEFGGPIKIGQTSVSISQRMKQLQTSHPEKLVCLGAIMGDDIYDSIYHEMFSDLRLKGEWFKPAPILLDFIDSNTDKNFDLDFIFIKEDRLDNNTNITSDNIDFKYLISFLPTNNLEILKDQIEDLLNERYKDVKGISYCEQTQKWRVRSTLAGKQIYIGAYNDIKIAYKALIEFKNENGLA